MAAAPSRATSVRPARVVRAVGTALAILGTAGTRQDPASRRSALIRVTDDAFVSIIRALFNTRDRAEHTRKRKIVSHTFSQKSVTEFEPYINSTLSILLRKWDALSEKASSSATVPKSLSDSKTAPESGWAWIELLDWMNALAFE